MTAEKIRKFSSGATRDTDVNKPNYIKALSPIVLQQYVDYIGKHRLQSDGKLRNWDNWKNGMPQEVYLDGLGRHFWAVWLLSQGFSASDNHGPVTLEDSLCAVIFNAQGMLHELLKNKEHKPFVCPAEWKIESNSKLGWWITFSLSQYLRKDGHLHYSGTGFDTHKFGEAPGYWPTKGDAEVALAAYLAKEKS